MKIKIVFYNIAKNIIFFIKDIIIDILSFLAILLKSIEISDLVGTTFIIIALVMVLKRIRLRIFQRLHQFSECPKCGQDLNRAHRTNIQKLFGWILYAKVMHFSCKKCNYRGLQVKHFTK